MIDDSDAKRSELILNKDEFPPWYARVDLVPLTKLEVVRAETLDDLGYLSYGVDYQTIFEKDKDLMNRMQSLINPIKLLRQISDLDISLFVVNATYGENESPCRFLFVGRSAEEFSDHLEIISRYNSVLQYEKLKYKSWGRNLAEECHFLHRRVHSTIVSGIRGAEMGVGDYHTIIGCNSIFFDTPISWDHEFIYSSSEETGKDVIIDMTLADDVLTPRSVYRTASGKVVSSYDFTGREPSVEELKDLETIEPIPVAFDALIVIDDIKNLYTDWERVPEEFRNKKYVPMPDNPSICTVLYGRTWKRLGHEYGVSGLPTYSLGELKRNPGDLP